MESRLNSYTIEIPKNGFRYDFDVKDEGCPYKKYAVISKVSKDLSNNVGLKVGDKVIGMNGVEVAGKDYVSLRNNMRQSINNCVKLEILYAGDSLQMSPEPCSISYRKLSRDLSKKVLVPVDSIRDKIRLFQKNVKREAHLSVSIQSRSSSCGCIPDVSEFINNQKSRDQLNSSSLTNLVLDNKNLKVDIIRDITQPISQEPFFDDSIRAASGGVIEVPLSNSRERVLRNKSDEHIKDVHPILTEKICEIMPEPFEINAIFDTGVPKIEISNYQNTGSLSLCGHASKLMPVFPENISRSSTNLFEDVSIGWQNNEFHIENHDDFISLTNINSNEDKNKFSNKKLVKQQSLLENIPIKLRILQFKEKVRSKSWKDYILERTENGVRFRKRIKSLRHDKTNEFEIKADDVNRFAIESPHKRPKTGPGVEFISTKFGINKYELMTSDNQVHLKFFFNPAIFQDDKSSKQAHNTYNNILEIFKPHTHKNLINVPLPANNVLHLSHSQGNISTMKEIKISNEEINIIDNRSMSSNLGLCKSSSKSLLEDISNNSPAETPSSSKSIFKQAFDKIKPEKKVKSYEVFTGTKADFEEFKRQVEGGILPIELDSTDLNGTNFNRFIHDVPRMINAPKIPMVIYLCTEIVEKIGLKCEGIYRISGNQRVIRTLSTTLNKGVHEIDTSLPDWSNVHAVCGTLKLFLRKLKQNLIPADLSHVLAYSCKAVDCDDPISLSKTLMDIRYHLSSYQNSFRRKLEVDPTKNIEDQLDCRWQTLQYLLKHLAKIVTYRKFNSMDEHALSVCFNPVVMESWQKNINDIKADNEIMIKALELILIHQDWLFVNWDLNVDDTRSTELMSNALQYSKAFIEKRMYGLSNKDTQPSHITNDQIDVNKLVAKIVSNATMDFGENKRLGRRHSSHVPGQKPILVKDKNDFKENNFNYRNSVVTNALDLSTHLNLIRSPDKLQCADQGKTKIKITYISSNNSLDSCEEKEEKGKTGMIRNSVSNKPVGHCDFSLFDFDDSGPNIKDNY